MATILAQPVNNFATTLASAHALGAGSLVLSLSPGTLAAGRIWRITALLNPNTSTESVLAIFEATGNTGATLTGVTAVEGTTNVALSLGTAVEIRMTAKCLREVQDALNTVETTLASLSPGGAVTSVFTRTGAVVAASGDYTVSQVTGAAPLVSPAFTGAPIAPDPPYPDASQKIATASWVTGHFLTTNMPISLFGDCEGSGTTSMTTLVVGLQNHAVASTAPTNGQVLTWLTSTSKWTPVTPTTGGGAPAVGSPVTGATAYELFFADASGNLAQSANVTYDGSALVFSVGSLQVKYGSSYNWLPYSNGENYFYPVTHFMGDVSFNGTDVAFGGGNLGFYGVTTIAQPSGDIVAALGALGLVSSPTVSVVSPTNTQTGTSYTLVLTDAGRFITLSNAAAITLTIPLNSSVPFPVDTQIDLAQYGAGQVTITATGGVTLNSYAGKVALAGQYAGATLKQTATNVWILIGNLA